MRRIFLVMAAAVSLFAWAAEEELVGEPPLGNGVVEDEAPSMVGEWQAYNELHGVVTQRLPLQYVFGELGWGILEEGKELEVQDWYQARKDYLLLRPGNLPEGTDESVVLKAFVGDGVFLIADPLVRGRNLRFERATPREPLTPAALAGTYRVEYRNPATRELRTKPFNIVLRADGTFTLDPEQPSLPYRSGQVRCSGDGFTLEMIEPSKGFWDNPSFVPYHETFIYNHPQLSIRLVKVVPEA